MTQAVRREQKWRGFVGHGRQGLKKRRIEACFGSQDERRFHCCGSSAPRPIAPVPEQESLAEIGSLASDLGRSFDAQVKGNLLVGHSGGPDSHTKEPKRRLGPSKTQHSDQQCAELLQA